MFSALDQNAIRDNSLSCKNCLLDCDLGLQRSKRQSIAKRPIDGDLLPVGQFDSALEDAHLAGASYGHGASLEAQILRDFLRVVTECGATHFECDYSTKYKGN